ncbi:hypothetical protein BT69DRAFT_1286722 [Atractiella rhizophila]|nr:hypothetical protein BT69DRAFT_1286722 [Atractiella rhizophila]
MWTRLIYNVNKSVLLSATSTHLHFFITVPRPFPLFLKFAFEDISFPRPALQAPVCQLCCLYLKQGTNIEQLEPSLKKTFTDRYLASGLDGGAWSLAENDRRRSFYFLGWKSRKHRNMYAETDLFDDEIDKLTPHTEEGWGDFVIPMQPH